jgi:hypothetical protein
MRRMKTSCGLPKISFADLIQQFQNLHHK